MNSTRHEITGLAVALLCLIPTGACAQQELIQEREGHSVRPAVRQPSPEHLQRLQLPDGFDIEVFARGLGAPRMMAVDANSGVVYVTRRDRGDVVALLDADGDGTAERQEVAVRGMPGVHGIALDRSRMFLCTVRELFVAEFEDGRVQEPRRILGDLPPGGRHPNRTLGIGPDGLVYITVGSTCNCCIEEHPESAAIVRVRPDGSDRMIFATGLRNTLGFGWHPISRMMVGMDHGTDWLGDTFPPEELNHLQEGKHYGWPFVYAKGEVIELKSYPPGFDAARESARSTPSVLEYTAHSAPLQMVFYTGTQFPKEYRNDAFVAMHGSWNRKPPAGYEVLRIRFSPDGSPIAFEPFLQGFLVTDDTNPWCFGRPAGIAVAKDGALLIGCDATGVIYRVQYREGDR